MPAVFAVCSRCSLRSVSRGAAAVLTGSAPPIVSGLAHEEVKRRHDTVADAVGRVAWQWGLRYSARWKA